MIWLELCTTYSFSSPDVTTTSIILWFIKHRFTWKMAIKTESFAFHGCITFTCWRLVITEVNCQLALCMKVQTHVASLWKHTVSQQLSTFNFIIFNALFFSSRNIGSIRLLNNNKKHSFLRNTLIPLFCVSIFRSNNTNLILRCLLGIHIPCPMFYIWGQGLFHPEGLGCRYGPICHTHVTKASHYTRTLQGLSRWVLNTPMHAHALDSFHLSRHVYCRCVHHYNQQ